MSPADRRGQHGPRSRDLGLTVLLDQRRGGLFRRNNHGPEDARERRFPGAAEQATGAVGDVVGSESVAEVVELIEAAGISVRGRNERQNGMAELLEGGMNEVHQLLSGADFTMMPS